MASASESQSNLLNTALAKAASDYGAANPKSAQQYHAATAYLAGGNTRTPLFYTPFPLTMRRGEDTYLWDLDDHKYIDFLGEFTAGICGHSHPKILSALRTALEDGLNLSAHTRFEAILAEAICKRFPSLERVRLTNSGTESNLMALSAAQAFTGRERVVVFGGAYHGGPLTFLGGASAANVPFDFCIAPYNDIAATVALLDENSGSIAAVLVEAMQGAGGCIPGKPEFLEGLRSWCDRHGALLIFDEVMTSRLHPNGLQAALGVTPDLTTLGKYIGGGMPFGAFGGRADVMSVFDPRQAGALSHAGTFNNNVMTTRAGLAAITEIYTEVEAERLNARGEQFRESLNRICETAGAPLHFTGLGSVMSLQAQAGTVEQPDQVASENKMLKDIIFFDLLAQGVFIARRGLIALNVCITEEHLDHFLRVFAEIVEARFPLMSADAGVVRR